ncbi:MAG: beta-hydroxyacyl-ACP dehydratase [Oligoflexia bacterium]|nr:beta-hydroxyacyl-ACP dehydratase [Oligoflexia bacterium]
MRFYLIDRIIEYKSEQMIRAIKNLSISEDFLDDHFPRFPVMPGVLMLEGAAQLSGPLLRFSLRKRTNIEKHGGVDKGGDCDRKAILMMIDRAKFRGLVRPGDQIIYTAEILALREDRGKTKVKGEVNGKAVMGAEISFMMVENDNPSLNKEVIRALDLWTRGGDKNLRKELFLPEETFAEDLSTEDSL